MCQKSQILQILFAGQKIAHPNYRCLREKHPSGEEDPLENQLQKHQIRCRRAISAAVLQGKGYRKRNVFSQTPVGNCTSQDFYIFSAQFLRGFVVSANLRNIVWSFYNDKWQSPQISTKLSQQLCRQISKSRLEKFPNPNPHKWRSVGRCHWRFQWKSTGEVTVLWRMPLNEWASIGKCHWKSIGECHWNPQRFPRRRFPACTLLTPVVLTLNLKARRSALCSDSSKPEFEHYSESAFCFAGCQIHQLLLLNNKTLIY